MPITQAEVLTEITDNGLSNIPYMANILSAETATLDDVGEVAKHCKALEASETIKKSDDIPGTVQKWEIF